MSYGSYDNQAPLNQPFNPTANTGIGSDIGRGIGNGIATGLFGENAQGPLSSVTRELPAMMGRAVYNNLPGAPNPEAQRNVEQSRAGGGILKLRQQPGQQPGGKSGGGKYATPFDPISQPGGPMPSLPVERSQYMPIPGDLPGTVTGPGMAMPTPEIIPSPMPATQPGGKSGGGMRFGNGKSATPMVDDRMYQRGDGTNEQMQTMPSFGQFGDTGQSSLMKAQNNLFGGQ
jgi:hypothetical protein